MKKLSVIFLLLSLFVNITRAQSFLYQAFNALNIGDFESALRFSQATITVDKKCADAYFVAAFSHMSLNQNDLAFININNAIKYNNKKSFYSIGQLYGLKGVICSIIGDNDMAIKSFNKAIRYDPNVPYFYSGRADLFNACGKYKLAIADLEKALTLDSGSEYLLAQVAKTRANAALSESQYRTYIDELITYLEHCSTYDVEFMVDTARRLDLRYLLERLSAKKGGEDDYFWALLRSSVYEDEKMYDEALAEYKALEKNMPEGIDISYIWFSMANCYQNRYQYPEAIKYYTLLIDSMYSSDQSERVLWYVQRAELYTENGELQKSVADWDTVLSLSDVYDDFAYYKKGWAKEKMHDNDGAFNDYCLGIKANDDYAYLYLMRGEQYMVYRNDTINANADFRKILEIDTLIGNGSCRHYALLFLGYREEAFEWMKKMIEGDPDDAGNYYDAACLYARAGELEKSVRYLQMALEHGFGRIKHIEQDDDLDPIRDRDDFKALMQKYY